MARGPLEGVRVLDMTRVWAGPLAARILGDLGADVIRIEASTWRTPARVPPGGFGIFPDAEPGARPWNRSGPINKLARNKRSVSLDLKTEPGRELFLGLVAQSDVVIENFSTRVLGSLGLDYATLAAANPRIVHVAMPGFGLTGPYRARVAYGPTVEPLAGLLAVLGYGPDEPRMTSIALPDAIAGVSGAAATLTALQRRQETGQGLEVELSMHEACVACFGELALERQLSGREPGRIGNAHPRYVPHGTYPCRGDDDWIAIACRDEAEWRALCRAAAAGWDADSRFATARERGRHRAELDAAVGRWTSGRDKRRLQGELQAAGVPSGALLDARELCEDPHLHARGFFVELDFEDAGVHAYAGSPFLIDGARHEGFRAGSPLGGDNERVLGELLGLQSDEIESLYARGVIADRPPGAPSRAPGSPTAR